MQRNMEDFIEKIRDNTCLWDVNCVQYRDVARKDMIWEGLARDCGMENGKEAKLLWKRLRDSHREALRRRRIQGTQIIRPWKYEHLMEFIIPGSREAVAENDEHLHLQLTQESDAPDEPEILISSPVTNTAENITTEPQFRKHKEGTLKLFEERAKRRRREMVRVMTRKKVDPNRSLRFGATSGGIPRASDALTELFSSMCKKTKQLPRMLQLRVQREVFDSVARAEEEALSYGDDQFVEDQKSPSCSYMFKTSPRSDRDSESFAASRDDDGSDN